MFVWGCINKAKRLMRECLNPGWLVRVEKHAETEKSSIWQCWNPLTFKTINKCKWKLKWSFYFLIGCKHVNKYMSYVQISITVGKSML